MSDNTPLTYDELIKIIVPLGQMIIVVLGWKIVSRDNDKREARKEIRSILNDMKKLVLDVEQLALKYYQLPSNQGHDEEIVLKRQLKQIGVLATSATRLNYKIDLSSVLADFRREITGRDFESADRKPLSQGDMGLDQFSTATTQFLDETERIFAEAYSR